MNNLTDKNIHILFHLKLCYPLIHVAFHKFQFILLPALFSYARIEQNLIQNRYWFYYPTISRGFLYWYYSLNLHYKRKIIEICIINILCSYLNVYINICAFKWNMAKRTKVCALEMYFVKMSSINYFYFIFTIFNLT